MDHDDEYERWKDKDVKSLFQRLDEMKVHSPGSTLFEKLEFSEYLEDVLKKIEQSEIIREIVLEGWLLVDYIITYLLRDGLKIPESIESELKIIPFSFVKKLQLIRRLRDIEQNKFPNQKSYWAFELHSDFHSELSKDDDFYKKFLEKAIEFENEKQPEEVRGYAIMRDDFTTCRFVPEWWFSIVKNLDTEWFAKCRELNNVRNVAAHRMILKEADIFPNFDVSSMREFRSVILNIINSIVFKKKS